MRLITGSEMKKIDAWAEGERIIPALLLMENAGRSVAQAVQELSQKKAGGNYVFLVGKGNNGGDALVAARHLYQQGADIKLFLLNKPEGFRGVVRENWSFIERLGLKWHYLNDDNSFYLFKLCLNNCDMLIDGILGTGLRGNLQGNVLRAIETLNASGCPTLAIDVPSGADADNGRVEQLCVRADYTVTFAWPKRGLVLYPAKKYVGRMIVADISLPQDGLALLEREEYYVDSVLAREFLPQRDLEGHKNTFGHVLVIAGSRGMTGAASLACKGVLRSGAGMVTACLPESLADLFDLSFPEVITRGVAETRERTLSFEAWTEIESYLKGKKAVVIGPGLGTGENIKNIVQNVLLTDVPVVIDADGLNVLAGEVEVFKTAEAPLILTPHPGEMARLLGTEVAVVEENRVEAAFQAATNFNAIVVLKGAVTVTAIPEGLIFINSTGSPALATAGSGDVLAGVIGGLLAQGLDPAQAAVLGVFLHGLAGDMLAESKGMRGLLAGEIADFIPLACSKLERMEAGC
jgi:hydroxyethylthiazole kinase-like uncharacterized protein yjeF